MNGVIFYKPSLVVISYCSQRPLLDHYCTDWNRFMLGRLSISVFHDQLPLAAAQVSPFIHQIQGRPEYSRQEKRLDTLEIIQNNYKAEQPNPAG